MGGRTIVVVGAKRRNGDNGFYFLTSGTTANGESLLDYDCRVALQPG